MAIRDRQVQWDSVPEITSMWPKAIAQVSIQEIDEIETSTGKSMLVVTFNGIEPMEVAGSSRTERFVIGTDEDPLANNLDTLGSASTYGFKLFKKMLAKAGVPFTSSNLPLACSNAVGAQLVLSIVHKEETKGDYVGRVRDEISGYFRLGEREPTIMPCDCKFCRGEPTTQTPTPTTSYSPPLASAPPPPLQSTSNGAKLLSCPICKEQVEAHKLPSHVAACAKKDSANQPKYAQEA